jgi:hypothetical protein
MLNELLANDAMDGPLNIAEVYSFAGNKSAALDWLERDFESRSRGVTCLGVDPFFIPLISEPRFVALLRNIGMTDTFGTVRSCGLRILKSRRPHGSMLPSATRIRPPITEPGGQVEQTASRRASASSRTKHARRRGRPVSQRL